LTSVPILIGGAAGSVATKLLLQIGFPVRATVRGDDERAQSLRALDAEVFVADLLDLRAVRHAIQ
jgi:NAD(P)H dehydrogenase (quinone)